MTPDDYNVIIAAVPGMTSYITDPLGFVPAPDPPARVWYARDALDKAPEYAALGVRNVGGVNQTYTHVQNSLEMLPHQVLVDHLLKPLPGGGDRYPGPFIVLDNEALPLAGTAYERKVWSIEMAQKVQVVKDELPDKRVFVYPHLHPRGTTRLPAMITGVDGVAFAFNKMSQVSLQSLFAQAEDQMPEAISLCYTHWFNDAPSGEDGRLWYGNKNPRPMTENFFRLKADSVLDYDPEARFVTRGAVCPSQLRAAEILVEMTS